MRVPKSRVFIHLLGSLMPLFAGARLERLLRRLAVSVAAATLLCSGAVAQSAAFPATGAGPAHPNLAAEYGQLPLSFEANQGQSDAQVRFLSRGSGYGLFLTDSAAVLTLTKPDVSRHARTSGASQRTAAKTAKVDVVRMELAGASRKTTVIGEDPLPGKANYFIGNDPAKWHANVHTYAKVRYQGVYPGVDLVYYGNQRQLEYDFVVAPGADPKQLRLRFEGAEKLKLDAAGELRVFAKNGQLTFHKPDLYQEVDGARKVIDGRFTIAANHTVSFTLGSYDRGLLLVIDPILTYSTYLGGSGQQPPAAGDCCGDYGLAIAVDAYGSAYVTGQTGSSDFPTTIGPLQKRNKAAVGSPGNAFVTKLNSNGTNVVYSTYLGGTGNYWWKDAGQGIAVDASGNAYITGYTGSQDFPITNGAYLSTNKAYAISGYTGFVTKLNPSGTALIYSTYLGGSGLAECCSPGAGDADAGIALDAYSNVYVAGTTYSTDYPVTQGAFQIQNNAKTIGQSNAFVTKLNAAGTALVYSSYLGGSGYSEGCCYFFSGGDTGVGLAVDGEGSAYVTGYAHSKTDFPTTPGAYQLINRAHNSINGTGAADINAFVTKFSPDGTYLDYSTYLGGSGNPYSGDKAAGIAVDTLGQAYITGQAGSTDFPTTQGSFQPKDIVAAYELSPFVTCLSANGSSLIYSTYLSGTGQPYRNNAGDYASGIAVDTYGDAYIVGTTESWDFPVTADAFQKVNNQVAYPAADYFPGNAFLAELNPAGSGLIYSSYLGGAGSQSGGAGGDKGTAVALDSLNNAYITGMTLSNNFPVTAGAFQTASPAYTAGHGNSDNAFVAQFGIGSGQILIPTNTMVSSDGNPAKTGAKVTFTAYVQSDLGIGTPTGSVTFSVDGVTGTAETLDGTGHAKYAISTLSAGVHSITAYYGGDSSYASSSGVTNETIVSQTTSITLTPNPSAISYGQALSVTALLSGSPAPTGSLTYTLDGGAGHIATLSSGSATLNLGVLVAGSHALSVSYAGDSTYGSASQSLSFTVAKALLTATAASFSRSYGTANPSLTYALTGFVNGDTSAVVGGSATLTTTATTTSSAGTYPITFATEALTAANYTFTYLPGTLTVTGSGSSQCETIDYSQGFTNAGLSLNGGATVTNKLLQLTDGGFFEARSAFYSTAVPVTSFTTDFTFQLLYALADGITFTIQSNNPHEVGQAGGGLGYAGIPHSVAIKADLFDNNGEGFDSTGAYLNGAYPSTPAINLFPAGINLHSGHIFAVHIAYANDVTTAKITDTVTSQSASITVPGDLSKVVGDTAYVGFTGGTGALTAIQNILTWSYSGGSGCPGK